MDRQSTRWATGNCWHIITKAFSDARVFLSLMDASTCFCPERFQLGGRLIHPLQYLETEELFLVKCFLVFEHEIDGPTQLVGQDR